MPQRQVRTTTRSPKSPHSRNRADDHQGADHGQQGVQAFDVDPRCFSAIGIDSAEHQCPVIADQKAQAECSSHQGLPEVAPTCGEQIAKSKGSRSTRTLSSDSSNTPPARLPASTVLITASCCCLWERISPSASSAAARPLSQPPIAGSGSRPGRWPIQAAPHGPPNWLAGCAAGLTAQFLWLSRSVPQAGQ